MRFSVVCLAVALAMFGCRKEQRDGVGATATIAPAEPQPASSGVEEALSQTVDIEDSRSEAEGGALTSPNPPVRVPGAPPPATTTTAATATTTAGSPPPASTTTR